MVSHQATFNYFEIAKLSFTTPEGRRVYPLEEDLIVNNKKLTNLIIDPHYEIKHKDYINDELIYNLIFLLNNKRFVSKDRKEKWEYYDLEISYNDDSYLLVWCFEDNENYIGIINCY